MASATYGVREKACCLLAVECWHGGISRVGIDALHATLFPIVVGRALLLFVGSIFIVLTYYEI